MIMCGAPFSERGGSNSGSGPLSSWRSAVRSANLDAQRFEPAAENGVMLLGQDLRRRHERSLEAGFHREQHRRDRDDGFAGANIALEQAVHRALRREIAAQLVDHAHLRIRQIERQTAQEFLEQLRPDRNALVRCARKWRTVAMQSTSASRKTRRRRDVRAPRHAPPGCRENESRARRRFARRDSISRGNSVSTDVSSKFSSTR